jgi:hypothetical protein
VLPEDFIELAEVSPENARDQECKEGFRIREQQTLAAIDSKEIGVPIFEHAWRRRDYLEVPRPDAKLTGKLVSTSDNHFGALLPT